MKALFNIIDGLADEYVEFLIDICNIESKSDNKEGLDRVYEIIKEHGESRGYEIKELILEKAGNVLSLTYNPEGKEKPVCIRSTIKPSKRFSSRTKRSNSAKRFSR